MLKRGELLSSIRRRMFVKAPRSRGEEDILVMKYVRKICESGRLSSAVPTMAGAGRSSGRIFLDSAG